MNGGEPSARRTGGQEGLPCRRVEQDTEKVERWGRLLKKFRRQDRREEETGAYWVVREASGATKKWRQATSAAETVRRPWHLKRATTPQMAVHGRAPGARAVTMADPPNVCHSNARLVNPRRRNNSCSSLVQRVRSINSRNPS